MQFYRYGLKSMVTIWCEPTALDWEDRQFYSHGLKSMVTILCEPTALDLGIENFIVMDNVNGF
jgi:hypothetical protein